MRRKITACLIIMALLFNLTACERTPNRYSAEFLQLFDTVTKIIGYAESKEKFSEYAQLIYDSLKEYHELYDKYNDYEGINNIKTINDNAGIQPVKVDQRIIDLLKFSIDAYDMSHGEINIAYGAVLEVWHDYREEGSFDPTAAKVPPMEVLQEKAKHTNIKDLIIDETEGTVYLQDPEMSLDVGAIAKGYATERVSRIAFENGMTSAILSVGGNVRTIGDKQGKPWNVGIQNPDEESDEENLYLLNLTDFSLVTSGDYERYYIVDGKRYHHIIDPKTLMPADYYRAVSIVCRDSGMADALSTTIFNLPFEEGLKLIEDLPETEALWVFKNGEMKYSSEFQSYIKK